jgi:hypothetical protein
MLKSFQIIQILVTVKLQNVFELKINNIYN